MKHSAGKLNVEWRINEVILMPSLSSA